VSRRQRRRWRQLAPALFVTAALGAAFAAGWMIRLDRDVRAGFEHPRWDLPTKVYSDTTALRPGQPLDADALAARLRRLDYAAARGAAAPGSFSQEADALVVHLRPISLPALERTALQVRIRFEDGRIAEIREPASGDRLEQIELEPLLLVGFFRDTWEERRLLKLAEIPRFLVEAVLAAEDRRFYDHPGLDARAIARAAWVNLRRGRVVEGGSTITQQLAKNFYLSSERTLPRKLREAAIALLLERRYTKDQILEAYLNEVYMGQNGPVGIFGMGQAAEFYFRRPLERLERAELAFRAGVMRSPVAFADRAAARARARRRDVLERMVAAGALGPTEAEQLARAPLVLASPPRPVGKFAPYYGDMVLAELAERVTPVELAAGGLRIYTDLDPDLQQAAEAALARGLSALETAHPRLRRDNAARLQGAIVVLEPATGKIKAVVGGRDYAESQFNRITQARRQPGSIFKPLVYLTAIGQAGATPATLIEDGPIQIRYQEKGEARIWKPQNDDRQYLGQVTLRTALERSLNIPAVKLAESTGPEQVIATARRLGISTTLTPVPSLALGTFEVIPLEIAAAYAAIAAGGWQLPPSPIQSVVGADGALRLARQRTPAAAVTPQAAYLVAHLLEGVVEHGTARALRDLGYTGPVAGKTGTTDETRDAWFVGFTPELLALVWVGFDDNRPLGLAGSAAALPIWADLMRRAAALGRIDPDGPGFAPPPGIEFETIDPATGLRANLTCPGGVREAFVAGTAPRGLCSDEKGGFVRFIGRILSF
jgi:penicillin-binding protein 1B